MKYLKTFNESIRNLMTGKSEEEVKLKLDNLKPSEKLNTIVRYKLKNLFTEEELQDIKKEILAEVGGYDDSMKEDVLEIIDKELKMDYLVFISRYNYENLKVRIENNFEDIFNKYDINYEIFLKHSLKPLIQNHKLQKINESIRDKMTPKSKDDIKKSLNSLRPSEKINKIFNHYIDSISKKEIPYYTQEEIDELVPEFIKLNNSNSQRNIDSYIYYYNVSSLIRKELKKELLKLSALKQLEYISNNTFVNLKELYTEEEFKELKEKSNEEANEYKDKGEVTVYDKLIGKIVNDIEVNDNKGYDQIKFTFSDGDEYTMYHNGDQADINIEDINGDIEDLIGVPLLVAEEVQSTNPDASESGTWTFYKFATIKGYVDIRWYGTSNGYYSEIAVFKKTS